MAWNAIRVRLAVEPRNIRLSSHRVKAVIDKGETETSRNFCWRRKECVPLTYEDLCRRHLESSVRGNMMLFLCCFVTLVHVVGVVCNRRIIIVVNVSGTASSSLCGFACRLIN
ncbi:hypothetical protein V8E51_000415 [Hyaloscypha variabilis]|jgi:hypothetical protein